MPHATVLFLFLLITSCAWALRLGVGVRHGRFQRGLLRLAASSVEKDVAEVTERVNAMRATAIKQALVSRGVDTRGLFDKAELAAALIRVELAAPAPAAQEDPSIRVVPMFEVSLGAAKQSYVGVDLVIKGTTLRFMMDTGSTMNLIRPDIVQRLGIGSASVSAYTVGVGGGGSVASRQTTIPNVGVGSTSVALDVAILDDPRMLPTSADGLLGLSFLQSLGDVVEFDFENLQFRYGPRAAMLSTPRRLELQEVRTRRIYTGLIATDVYVNGGTAPLTAMVDMGAAHTIANPLAVQAITGKGLDALPASANMCAGIDGKPVAMRTLNLNRIQIGSQLTAQGPISVYAADIPGMSAVGLGSIPAVILGMDVIGRRRMLLDIVGNSLYVQKKQ